MFRALRIFAEFVAAFLGVLLLACVALVWRLNANPVNSTFLTPYIESAIERQIPDAHLEIAHTLLSWDNIDHSLTLHADSMVIKNGVGSVIAQVPNLDIRLSVVGLVVGQFWPTQLTINHPQIKLNRRADGKIYFADMTTSSSEDADQADSRKALQKTMFNLSHAYAMRHLAVFRAVIAVHDEATNSDWSVSVPEIVLKRTMTQLEGDVKIDLTQKDKPASLELHYAYDTSKDLHRVSTRFQDITPSQLVGGHPETLGLDVAAMLDLPLSGEVEMAFNPALDVAAAAVTLHGGSGFLQAPKLWDHPRAITSLDVQGDYDSKERKLNLTTAAVDFGGPTLAVTGLAHAPMNPTKYDLDFTLSVTMANVPMDSLGDLWPKGFVDDTRDWVVHNLTKGNYDKGEATFAGSLAWHDLANLAVTAGEGKLEASHGTVVYIDGMPPVVDVSTVADFDLRQMNIKILGGGLGALRLQPFSLVISGFADEDQYIDIPMKITGPIVDVVTLIDHPPLGYARAVGLPVDAISGTADGVVHLRFPLLKSLATKDIDVAVTAQLGNVASTQLVKGVTLSQGALQLDLDKDGLAVKGDVVINKIPAHIAMQQMFTAAAGKPLRQIMLDATIKDDQWKLLGVDAVAATRGSAVARIKITQPVKTRTQVSGDIDLTNTDLHVDMLSWKKPPGQGAHMQFSADMTEGKDITVKSISLEGPQLAAQGRVVIGNDGMVKEARFDPLNIGRTSATLSFMQSFGDKGALRFDVRGKTLDITGMQGGKDPARKDARPKDYHLKLDKLYTSATGFITNVDGFAVRDEQGWSAIDFHGFADGDHRLDIQLTTEADNTRRLSVSCNDFGKMLKGLGLTDTVREGNVKVEGASTPEHPREIDATINIGSFTVGKLPVLMLLFNATSPFGFMGILTDSASFDHMKGTFHWAGDEISALQVNAAGSAVGMNIEGRVDMDSGQANLNGAVVPFSMVNRVLGAIPILGDILTGGDGGGVLAVAYSIKGSLSDPKISVNPISLLTPGFLRNLFFGGDDGPMTPEQPAAKPAEQPAQTTSPVRTNFNRDR